MWLLQLLTLVFCVFNHAAASVQRDIPPALKAERSFYKRDGVDHTVLKLRATNASLDFVKNSGICETTPGVNQYSGYLDVGTNQSLFFWFFEARNDPQTAPLATWFNGGPGCSSMFGLFQENGPCHFEGNATEPTLNPYSWNEYANMLYVDQPFGTGFSDEFGSPESDVSYDSGEDTEGNAGPSANSEGIFNPLEVNSTVSAAASVWKFLQAFYDEFPQYGNRDFGIFTEAYGGHYGSEFADYFQSQNKGIAAGSVTGHKISLVALGINNGWFDSAIQEKAYIDFSLNNTYKPLINESFSATVLQGYNEACLPAMQNCTSLTADDMDCYMADYLCQTAVDVPLLGSFGADFNVYDIREDVPQPSAQYATYLQRFDVMKAIGAKGQYRDCSRNVSDNFIAAGDHFRSYMPALSSVVQSGLTTIIWAGDADFNCNWFGNLDVVNALAWSKAAEFKGLEVSNYTVNGTVGGTFKTLDNLSWLRVFEAGHEVMFYKPELSLQVFKQTMGKKAIFSTNSGDEGESPPPPTASGDKHNDGVGSSTHPYFLMILLSACLAAGFYI